METVFLVSMIALWLVVLVNLVLTVRVVRWLRSVAAMQAREAERAELPELPVGQPAPDFKARTLSGERVSLAQYAGHGVAFVFVSPRCGSCQASLPMLNKLSPRARQRADVELVLVSDASAAETQTWLDSFQAKTGLPVDLPVLVPGHPTATLIQEYNPRGLFPFFCFVDGQGVVQARDALGQGQWTALKLAWEGPPEVKPSAAVVGRFR